MSHVLFHTWWFSSSLPLCSSFITSFPSTAFCLPPYFFSFPPACIIRIYPTLLLLFSSISLQLLDFALPLFPHLWKSLSFYSRSLPVTPRLYDFLFLPLPLSSSENDFLQPACLDFLCLVFVSLLVLISFLPFPSFFFNQTKNSTLPLFSLSFLSPCLPFSFSMPSFPPFHSSPSPTYTFHFLRGQRLWSCSDWILLPSHLNTWKLVTSDKQRPQSLLSPNIPTPLLIIYRQDASGIKHLSSPAVNRLSVWEKIKKMKIWSRC